MIDSMSGAFPIDEESLGRAIDADLWTKRDNFKYLGAFARACYSVGEAMDYYDELCDKALTLENDTL